MELIQSLLKRAGVTVALNTEEFAAGFRVKPNSVRSALCRDGHYLGIRPTKLPNGRLLWPADAFEQMTKGGAK